MSVKIFGHINPDTDSIASAIALEALKRAMGMEARAYRLGPVNRETAYVLDRFDHELPPLLGDVRVQVSDLAYDRTPAMGPDASILKTFNFMKDHKIRTLPIIDEARKLLGIVTMRDISMALITGNYYRLSTSFRNVIDGLNARVYHQAHDQIEGNIMVAAYHYGTFKREVPLTPSTVMLVGDRFDVIERAIEHGVQLIIVTGGLEVSDHLMDLAIAHGVSLIGSPHDTYITSKLVNQLNYIHQIMKSKHLVTFRETAYLEELKEEMQTNQHSRYPVIDDQGGYLGTVARRHILNPGRKRVILVDHNEYGQSAEGIEEAEILEVVDHHKLGDLSTHVPICFRNMPVGSTNTIIYNLYREQGIAIEPGIAGLMIAGIISDTLYFKSPTTTDQDKRVVEELLKLVDLDLDAFALDMFREGTKIEGADVESLVMKDFKAFNLHGYKVGICQLFTLDTEHLFERKEEILEKLSSLHESKDHHLTLMMITDIIREGSYLLYEAQNERLLSLAFGGKMHQGRFVEGVVSRKKQTIPRLLEAFNVLG